MGAVFDSRTFPDMSKAELKKAFAAKQDDLCAEFGSGGYQGHLGLADGLSFGPAAPFASECEAFDYCEEVAGKRGPAVAVRFRVGDGLRWFVGASCPS